MKAFGKIVSILLSILLWVIIFITALFTFTTLATRDDKSVARLAGFTPLIVQSDSMAPTFRADDLILIRACKTEELREGDIITFHTIINNEYALNTHRIEKIEEIGGIRNYITKGDNNEISDPRMISDGDIVGIYVTKLPVMGRVMTFLTGGAGFLIVIVLPMLLFFIYQIYHLVIVSINLKKAIAAEEAVEKAQKEAETEAKEQEAQAKLAEAQAALEEARRLKEEAQAKLAEAQEARRESAD